MKKLWKLLVIFTLGAGSARIWFDQGAAAQDIFTAKVAPILEANCVSCHGARVQRGGLDLRTEASILKGGSKGAVVTPGKAESSLLYQLITHREEPAMPLGGEKLKPADIEIISAWIDQLKAPAAAAAADAIPTRSPGYSITEKDRQFWSFMKPVRPAVPPVSAKNRRWARNEIDAFILASLEKNGLNPSRPAGRRELLRRVSFDLTGLPPSPEEMEAFSKVSDAGLDAAYGKIVEKLLASSQYGERWGRHWLDLARYADSGGYEFDIDRPHAWRYRDYVIRSFNQDKPYDQFIREQLANDELKPGDVEALVATGFCRNGPTVDNADNEETRMDELDDMTTTTSSVFLGLTVGCARCHDHKYDPIPQRDYYRMQAVFFPFEKAERPLVSAEEAAVHKARNKEIDQRIKPHKEQIAAIEKRVRDILMAEKVEFHVRLAESSNGLEGKTREQYRAETAERFAKSVNLQPEEIDPLLRSEEIKARKEQQNEIDQINRTRPKPLPSVMGIVDKSEPGQAHLLKRGDWRNKGEAVGPGYPSLFSNGVDLKGKDRRKQLADWIASPDNPLTARVIANRVWQYHFGKGIVRTPSDFGLTGDRPTHPELLDWLAVELMDPQPRQGDKERRGRRGDRETGRQGDRESPENRTNPQSAIRNPQSNLPQSNIPHSPAWSLKHLHRLIVLSSAYRQSSVVDAASVAKDPENRLFWRMNPQRLTAEAIRDSILAISLKLNPEMYGPGVYPRIDPDVVNTGSRPRWPLDAKDDRSSFRRSVYIYVKRSVLLPMIEVFDCPATTVSGPVRSVSTVSPQALALLNNDFVLEQAGFFADRLVAEAGKDVSAQIARAFLIALGRSPSEKEMVWSSEFIKAQTLGYTVRKHEKPQAAALRDFCHAVVNLSEFLYID